MHFFDVINSDPELRRVIESWATLPAPIQRAMLALIDV